MEPQSNDRMGQAPTEPTSASESASESAGTTRRDFLKFAGAGAATAIIGSAAGASPAAAETDMGKASPMRHKGIAIKPRVPMATGRVIGANDRINIAVVGVGGRGSDHLGNCLNAQYRKEQNINAMAASDCYQLRLENARGAMTSADPTATVQVDPDYRRLLENKDVDAVIVTTPEHWHAQVAIDAMEAGKHVYCEKPMTRYLNEAFALYDTQRRTGRVVQVGSQGCSDAKWWTAGRAIRDGKIGQVVDAQGSYTRNSTDGEWNYYIDPKANPSNLDWKTWLGTAPERPWSDEGPSRFFRYRKYRDYSAGLLGDLLPHKAHPLMIALFLDKPEFPIRVTSLGTRKISTDREVADNIHIVAEFPSGATMYFVLSTVNEQGVDDLIRGHKATIYFGGGKVQIKPERAFGEDVDQQDIPVIGPGEDTNVHRADWFNCIRTGKIPNCNVDLAVKTQTLESMAEMAELERRTFYFDPDKREVSWKPGVDYLKEIPQKA